MTELLGRVSLSDNTAPLSAHSQGALVDTNKKPGMVLVTQLVVSFVLTSKTWFYNLPAARATSFKKVKNKKMLNFLQFLN